MLPSKRELRAQVSRGELKEAAEAALAYAEYCQSAEPANQLTVLNSRLHEHGAEWNTGRISYDEFSRAHAKIAYDLTAILEDLPDQPAPNAGKRKLLDEAVFKKRLFYFLCISNLVVMYRVYYLSPFWTSSLRSISETFAIIGLLIPVFAAYLPVMLGDYLRTHREGLPLRRRYVSGPLITVAYWLFPIYTFLLLYVLEMYAGGTDVAVRFADLTAGISLIETLLGGYIGQIVFAFFKKE